jgi:hypothetical protein
MEDEGRGGNPFQRGFDFGGGGFHFTFG